MARQGKLKDLATDSEATITAKGWTSDNKSLEDLLNTIFSPVGRSPSYGDPIVHAFYEAVNRLLAEVIEQPEKATFDPNVVY